MTHVHFIGIGGAGLSAIAHVLLESGYTVSGSDEAQSPFAQALSARGAAVHLGEQLPDVPVSYLILDRGATIDPTTGFVRGDSIRETAVRVVAFLNGLQTQSQPLFIVPAPDSLMTTAGVDTLEYSLVDTTANVSSPLAVQLLSTGSTPVPVRGWVVSFEITYAASPELAEIIGDGNRESSIDTTSTDGSASRRIRVHPDELTATSDSVVLTATARYRGAHVRGSPARLVVHLRPRAP